MRPVPQKTVDRKRAIAVKNSAQRKKLAAALVLLVVMGVLWLRVFAVKDKPQAAKAAAPTDVSTVASSASAEDNVVFVDLPVVPERHNVLANDFFDAKLFKGFGTGDLGSSGEITDPNRNSQDTSAAGAAVDAMELVAIVNDKKPQAFIEDKLLEEGQSFKFVFHDQNYEFKVVKIHSSKVELECNGAILTKRIPESSSGLNNKE
ncbi:MAG: hypothetical protein WC770_07040 [Phycisphaerae bacterium]